ncbi:MAG: sterol desaturase family protein [Chitinophagales bacterium]|nr:sterol desaturase family protein [Chitinophagales bacterium]
MSIIVYSIPAFFILIGVEYLVAALKKEQLYRLNDTIANLNCGITQQVLGLFLKLFTIGIYTYIYEYHRLFEHINMHWYSWILLLIGVDYFYYWFHRLSHEIAVLWGTHVVHHQSEEYNLSVALRQSAIQVFGSLWFYLPLAFIGFDPISFVTIASIQTVYQFWIHTKVIDKMPKWFEFIFNTPSHHRVHHGINPIYIDKNHGGTFIIFDRMFGTFQAELETVHYGVTKPLNSWNAVWANIDYYKDLWNILKQCRNPKDVVLVLIKAPGWQPAYLGGPMKPQPVPNNRQLFDAHANKTMHLYIAIQFVLLLAIVSFLLFKKDDINLNMQYFIGAFVFFSAITLGNLFTKQKIYIALEAIRILLYIPMVYFLIATNKTMVLVSSAIFCIMMLWYLYRAYLSITNINKE